MQAYPKPLRYCFGHARAHRPTCGAGLISCVQVITTLPSVGQSSVVYRCQSVAVVFGKCEFAISSSKPRVQYKTLTFVEKVAVLQEVEMALKKKSEIRCT